MFRQFREVNYANEPAGLTGEEGTVYYTGKEAKASS